jgi:DnaJ-class molecular chaperone
MARKNKCEDCNGFGWITIVHYFTRKQQRETCRSCGGTGRA